MSKVLTSSSGYFKVELNDSIENQYNALRQAAQSYAVQVVCHQTLGSRSTPTETAIDTYIRGALTAYTLKKDYNYNRFDSDIDKLISAAQADLENRAESCKKVHDSIKDVSTACVRLIVAIGMVSLSLTHASLLGIGITCGGVVLFSGIAIVNYISAHNFIQKSESGKQDIQAFQNALNSIENIVKENPNAIRAIKSTKHKPLGDSNFPEFAAA